MMDPETNRQLIDLRKGETVTASEFSLSVAPATSTSVDRRSVSESSVIHFMAYSSNAAQGDITRIAPFKGGFIVTHTASASVRTYKYDFVTGNRT